MEKTLKELLDNYYLIPKDIDFEDGINCSRQEAEQMIKEFSVNEAYEEEYNTKHICLVPRRVDKKLSNEEAQKIKEDPRSYRQLAKAFNLSLSTISRIKNDMY